MKRMIACFAVAGAATLAGASITQAQDYPPATTAPPTTDDGSGTPTPTDPPTTDLPPTGSSGTDSTMMIAGVVLAAGAGMFAVSRARGRQPATS